ncbi:hypothetical protein [Halogeometricum luteum]|uniref:Transglutaminase-like superfamily protein n=1 Tax=Halogeometricum luteum TaxID=2950537 RepID=A0ABU2G6L3_9EURY|nr:hypothetical protein [Halogeometricum sp. S3BR5-2]MDS0296430.1 hypothetical protein [Halogeometricum sp. S3BR5-2]
MSRSDDKSNDSLGLARRKLLTTVGTGSLLGLAGCIGGASIEDTDGDGVIDSKDYAPRDKSVQERADVKGTAKMTPKTDTPTQTPVQTPTKTLTPTPSSTSTPVPKPETDYGTITAKNPQVYEGRNYISSYSSTKATIQVVSEDMDGITANGNDLLLLLANFPREQDHEYYRTSFSANDSGYTPIELDLEFPESAKDELVHFLIFFIDEDVTYESASLSDFTFLGESDPFVVDTDTQNIRRDQPDVLARINTEETDYYTREDAEGAFALSVSGRTKGREWSASYFVFKSAYALAVERDHGRSREEFVSFEMQNGFAGEFAAIISDIALDNDFSEKVEQVEFIIDFVQRLPYVPDDVSTGYNDYTKYTLETLTELGGDCEDTSILLAGILQCEPFGYDMVLIQPPGHMGTGIYGTDLQGSYWEYDERDYYYIETTGEGWGIGDYPESLEDDAYVYQV